MRLREFEAPAARPVVPKNLIFRYSSNMRTVTATEASRNFKALLDAVEAGESIAIARGGKTIAEMRPQAEPNARAFFEAIEKLPKPSKAEYEKTKALLDDLRKPEPDYWNQRPWNLF